MECPAIAVDCGERVCLGSVVFMSFVSAPRRFLPGLLSLCVVLSSPSVAKVQPLLSDAHLSYAAQLRMRNRARLLKQYHAQVKKQASYVVEGNAQSKSALRQQNRTLIKQHPEWFPGPLKASDQRWQELAENDHFLSSDHLHNITEVAIHRLEQQLGKPYLWGGTSPEQGFDCSGLIFMPTTKFWQQNCHVRRMKCITIGGRPSSLIATFVVVIYCSFIFTVGILPIIWASIWGRDNLLNRRVQEKRFG